MTGRQRELTHEETLRVLALEQGYRLARGSPDRALGLALIAHELTAALGELRASSEPFGVSLIEIILGDVHAEIRELERARAHAEDTERRRQERADVMDAPRQVAALDADGGASDLTIEEWLAHVERSDTR